MFHHREGWFKVSILSSPPIQYLHPGLLPLPFFLRFGLSRSWERAGITLELFLALFSEPIEVKISADRDTIDLLGDSKGELLPYTSKFQVFDSKKSSPALQQMIFICWGLGYAELSPEPKISKSFREVFDKLNAPEELKVSLDIPSIFKKPESLDSYGELALEEEVEILEEEGKTILVSSDGSEFELELSEGTEVELDEMELELEGAAEEKTKLSQEVNLVGPENYSTKNLDAVINTEQREGGGENRLDKFSDRTSAEPAIEETVDVRAATKMEVGGSIRAGEEYQILELFLAMKKWEASDLFLTEGKPPAIRLNGKVLPLELPEVRGEQLKAFIGETLTATAREKFEREGEIDFGFSIDLERRFRINLHRQMGRISLAVRALPSGELSFEELGLPPVVEELADSLRGLILVTGATGSGKSTTLAALVHYINTHRDVHIITIEDPIEFIHKDIRARVSQREVGTDTTSFHAALRNVVRESPDVIMIGEMRDRESIEVAISAALTGHLVLSSLHTVDSVQTLQRILSYFPERLQEHISTDLSLCLRGIISQRLIPKSDGSGRVLATEILTVTPAVSQLLRQQRIEELNDLLEHSNDPHLRSFNRSLLELYREGLISYEMGRAYATNPDQFALATQGMEVGSRKGTVITSAATELDLKSLLQITLEKGASDLHLTVGRPPILRIDGKLQPLPIPPLTDADMRTLLFSTLTTPQRTIYQLEKEIDFALSLDDGQRFRINAYYQKGKMAASLRAIPSQVPDPRKLSIPEEVLRLADAPHGLLLVTGPTGSGKTTTLACMIQRINKTRPCRIITIEDPIEFIYESEKATIDQREIHADTKSFSSALKYILRQDPDVILVGEMRDLETISSALTAAETGHLVLASIHTNDAIQTIDRIIDVFPSHQQDQIRSQLSASLLGIVSQRLLPRKGRPGRIPAFEILVATPAIRNLIREDKMHQARSIMESSRSLGMITMDYSLRDLYAADLISYQDAMRYITNPKLLG